MKRHTYTALRATAVNYANPVVIVRRTKFETWHWFTSEALADKAAQEINRTGRLPKDFGSGQRLFEKLGIFGFPDQYKHYEQMEAGL